MIDLENRRFVVFGLPGSGKSALINSILDSTRSHLVYDPLNDHPNRNRYLPEDRHSITELDRFIERGVLHWKPRLFVIDEANLYARPKPTPLPRGIASLNDFSRHYSIGFGLASRRPTQFHSDITELAHYMFIFHLPGKNDYRFLEDTKRGLGDIVQGLGRWEFAVLDRTDGSSVSVHSPIANTLPEMVVSE